MIRNHFTLTIVFLLFVSGVNAQSNHISIIKDFEKVSNPEDENLHSFFNTLNKVAHIDAQDLKPLDEFIAVNGDNHIKFQQYHKGLKVLGGIYNIHLKDDRIKYANGQLAPHLNFSSISPTIQEERLIQIIGNHLQIEENLWSSLLKITHKSLVIADNIFPKNSGFYTLAYNVNVAISQPFDKVNLVIDAHTGRVIFKQSNICSLGVEGKGKSKYYGEVSFQVDSIGPNNFMLKDENRNITTYTVKNRVFEQYFDEDNYWDLTSEDQDEVAIDAHYCTSRFYDMMANLFLWNGLDGNGLNMNPVVHANQGKPLLNAFWDGQNAYFGNGDCHHSPLTTLSVVGHEFMHGITNYTSDLIYADESGAINESMSDIFGKSLEYLVDNENFSWELGPEFSKSPYASYFRNMADPNAYDDPSLYKGEFWDFFGGVHTNSGVFNYWFYLMITGQNGINEKGITFNVSPNAIDDVLQIVWLTQRAYLTPSSTYPDLYDYTLEAGKSLYGESSGIYNNMKEAWKACGLPYEQIDTLQDLSGAIIIEDKSTCFQDAPFDLKFQVINNGSLPVVTGDTLFIRITSNPFIDTILEIVLQQDLMGGEIFDYEMKNIFRINEDRLFFINMVIINKDDVENNNYTAEFFRNYVDINPTIYATGMSIIKPTCFSDQSDVEFFVGNFSCSPIPTGTSFSLLLKDEVSIIYQKDFIVAEDISSGNRIGYNFKIEDFQPQGDVIFELQAEDVLVKANNTEVEVRTTKLWEGGYYNSFDDKSILEDFTIRNIYGDLIYDWNGDNVFGLVGTYHGENKIPCPDTEENISLVTHGESNLSVCLDLSKLVNPVLSFDLIQFRYDAPNYPDLVENTAVVRVKYEDENISFKEVIHNQQEGELINRSFALPDKFKGKLNLDFFAHYAENGTSTPFDFDANLIDNLTISGLSSTYDNQNNKVKISPNPTANYIQIETLEEIKTVQLLNLSGQEMKLKQSVSNRYDISQFSPGVYILKIMLANSRLISKKIVKI